MRLLIVEDEGKLAHLVKRALVAERFSVDVAHDGKDWSWELRTTTTSSSWTCCYPSWMELRFSGGSVGETRGCRSLY